MRYCTFKNDRKKMKEKLEKETVLDPMMGSGTTGLARLNLRRKFIGIDKNLETFEIAKIRINKTRI